MTEQQKIQLGRNQVAIVRHSCDRFDLVPMNAAQKIKQRDSSAVVEFAIDEKVDDNDPYADYQVPDDLDW